MIILFPLTRFSAAPTPSRGSARRVVDQTDLPFGRTAALHDRWSTTAAVPGNYTTYKLEKETGFLMTAADPANLTVELEDCVSQWPGHPDHILEQVGVCESARYQRLRTAGRVYSYPQQRTVPLYRCYNAQDQSHFASNEANCEKLGAMERLLGYALGSIAEGIVEYRMPPQRQEVHHANLMDGIAKGPPGASMSVILSCPRIEISWPCRLRNRVGSTVSLRRLRFTLSLLIAVPTSPSLMRAKGYEKPAAKPWPQHSLLAETRTKLPCASFAHAGRQPRLQWILIGQKACCLLHSERSDAAAHSGQGKPATIVAVTEGHGGCSRYEDGIENCGGNASKSEGRMNETIKYQLDERRIPKVWYNIQADLPKPPPPVLHPGTKQPVGPDDLAPLFPMALIMQEVATEREVEIPEPVRDIYRMWRPTPLFRARAFETKLGTPAKIFYKYEGVSPAGSHKPNTAIPQAFYNKQEGVKRLSTETGAGQWGSSLALAGSLFGLEVIIYQVRVSFDQKPYRRALMETYGANCLPSPSDTTNYGRKVLAERPDHPGSLGIAISEAVEIAAKDPQTKYALGSVLNHVLLHQTVIGQEAIEQLAMADVWPDVVIGCAGGGSNFSGIAFPFIGKGLQGKARKPRIIAVEPAACPSLTRGKYAYDFGDTGHMTPLVKMHTLGSGFTPPGFHAGGLRYHGMSALVSHLKELGEIEAVAYQQRECFDAAVLFARCEGIVPAPETTHAIKATVEEALRCKREGKPETILFNLSGHGHFDMAAYIDYFSGKMQDVSYDERELAKAMADLPAV